MDVFCVGMYRSASTWQYDIAAELLQRRNCQRLGFVVGKDYQPPSEPGWRILNSHDGHESFAAALQAGQALALYSWRDLRDVCFSLIHKLALGFEHVTTVHMPICLQNDAFWRSQPRVLLQRYETLIGDVRRAVNKIARHLGITLARREAQTLAQKYSLEANRQRAETFAEELRQRSVDLADPLNAARHWEAGTLLHWNHIRTGQVGGWRDQATEKQRCLLANLVGTWLIEQGYERDLSWVNDPSVKPDAPGIARTLLQLPLHFPDLGTAFKRMFRKT